MLSSSQPNGSLFLEPELNLISELQAPLLGIAANARVASEKLARDDARITEYLEAIEFSSKNLVRTIDILLRSRDVETEGLALDVQPLHIGLRVEEAIEKLAPLCRVQAQILNFRPNKSLLISANDDCLGLIVYHVIEQALRASASEEIISVELASSGAHAKLVVKAKGTRERATNLRKLIKKSMNSGDRNKQLGGVNFSLIASARLLEVMGGSFLISQRKDGISFNLRFPLSSQGSLFG
ncbi:MAG: hypothetical protein QG623_676 [Patescibacteria group bacterium]|nr:hypothetical protein [Patescibacteria group bacterium]